MLYYREEKCLFQITTISFIWKIIRLMNYKSLMPMEFKPSSQPFSFFSMASATWVSSTRWRICRARSAVAGCPLKWGWDRVSLFADMQLRRGRKFRKFPAAQEKLKCSEKTAKKQWARRTARRSHGFCVHLLTDVQSNGRGRYWVTGFADADLGSDVSYARNQNQRA